MFVFAVGTAGTIVGIGLCVVGGLAMSVAMVFAGIVAWHQEVAPFVEESAGADGAAANPVDKFWEFAWKVAQTLLKSRTGTLFVMGAIAAGGGVVILTR
jgi:hypothetical protein